MTIEPTQWAAILGIIVVISGVVMVLIHARLAKDFVDVRTHEGLVKRVEATEAAMARAASHEDVRGLSARMSQVEIGLASASADIKGVHQGVERVEHMVTLLVKHELGVTE